MQQRLLQKIWGDAIDVAAGAISYCLLLLFLSSAAAVCFCGLSGYSCTLLLLLLLLLLQAADSSSSSNKAAAAAATAAAWCWKQPLCMQRQEWGFKGEIIVLISAAAGALLLCIDSRRFSFICSNN